MTQTLPDTLDDPWLARSRETVARIDLAPQAETVGRVERVGDGIALVSGLPDACLNELLRFDGGRMGFALTLDADSIGAVLLDDGEAIEAGSRVTGTGEVVRVPVGPGLLGRIVDPLGRPLDRDEPVKAEAEMPVERPAPAIIERDLVSEPMDTGILVVDALFAVGRGQRELIIGDRATGKTAIGVDTIINQKHTDVICVYVAIGQRATAVQRVIDAVQQHGAPERCVFVVASAAASAGTAMDRAIRGLHDRRIFPRPRPARAGRRRRSDQARRDPPRTGAADPRAARPRSLSRRHLLPAFAPARALGEAVGRARRRLADRIADRRDRCRQSVRLYPDQPDLDHRRADRARFPPLRRQPAPGRRCRPQCQPGGRQGANCSDASRVRPGPPRLCAISRTGNVHPLWRSFGRRVKAQITRGERIRALITQPRFAALRLVDEVALLAALADGVFDPLPAKVIEEVRGRVAAHLDAHAGESVTAVGKTGTLDDAARAALVSAVGDLAKELAAGLEPKAAAS